jgi:hypothetical protein
MVRASAVIGLCVILPVAAYAKGDPSGECKYAGEVYSYA